MNRSRASRSALVACFLLLVGLFAFHLLRLGSFLDAPAIRADLEERAELRPLPRWEVSLFRCPSGIVGLSECEATGAPFAQEFPDPRGLDVLLARSGATPGERANAARLRYVLEPADHAFLSRDRIVTFVLPRSVQRRVRVEAGGQVWETTGIGVTAQTPMVSDDLLASGEIVATYFFPELPWFGPADQPPALVRNESVETYVSLPLRTIFGSELPDLVLVGFPLLLVALALVLDHSSLFRALSFFGAAQAARGLLAITLTHSRSDTWWATAIAWGHLALDGAFVATLVTFVVTLCTPSQARVSQRAAALALAVFPAAFVAAGAWQAVPGTGPMLFLTTSGNWADVVACSLSLPFLLLAITRARGHFVAALSTAEVTRRAEESHLRPRAAVVALAMAWHLAVVLRELRAVETGAMRTPFDPARHVLLPVLIVTTLFSVGSVTNRMIAYAGLMKARLEQLLKGTRELASARTQVQAFARALKTVASELGSLREASYEIVLPAHEGRVARYVCSGERAAAGDSPLFDGFVPDGVRALTRATRDMVLPGGKMAYPLWYGEKWKGTLVVSGIRRDSLAREDEEFLGTLLQGVAITLENLGTLDALERADKLKDEFLANTSHELRTPLTGIIGLAESLLAQRDVALNAGSKRAVALIVSSARRLANLVGDILDFSKLRENNLDLQRRPISLASAIEVAVALCRPLVGSKRVELKVTLPDPCPPVLADENRLQQILSNLLGNAIKFTESGEIVVSVAEAEGSLGRVAVSVRDTGPGIAEEHHDAIFQSFVQVGGGPAHEHGGTGLGLAVTKRLVELHKGTIAVTSRPGEGATFTFTLPISSQPAEEWRQDAEAVGLLQRVIENPVDFRENETHSVSKPPREGASAQTGGSLAPSVRQGQATDAGSLYGATVLVVDDEAINREVLRVQLELEGCQVRLATTGDEALERLGDGGVDLVLLDLMLPRRNGFDVCRAIRTEHEASTLPVILLTAKNQVSDLVTAFEAGANDFLSKPFSRRELVARVRNHLRLARTHIAYARFVPNDLLRMLGKTDIIDVRLGDQVARDMTVLFLDIRGFTRLSESLTAKETFDFLNSYFDTVNPVVVRNRGFIDKYIGDAVLALFPEHPGDAVRACVELLEEVRRFNAEGRARGRPEVEIGLGAHCGKIMLGTIGNSERMEGTVISETVNVASRLEGMSKFFGASLVTTLELVGRLGDAVHWRPIGRVRAKGSSRTLRVVEVFEGDAPALRDAKRDFGTTFGEALTAYEARSFEDARRGFATVRDACEGDAVAAFYVRECERLMAFGVDESWDGTLHLETK